ncbi:MAG TPA: glycine/sarcosine/betaine reductase selenoprotein B family protein [Ktedonobacterales bacterium]|nr:glycine/sarcosine/betaine reductase selenoprotein B family protein [Ktedonobacterales bacterium]
MSTPDDDRRQMLSPHLEEQRATLTTWLATAGDAMRRKDWRQAYGTYPRLNLTEDAVPWAPPPADLRQARLCLVGSAGVSAPGQAPFDAANPLGDLSWRGLPVDTDLTATSVAHEHYDSAAALADRNSVFPLDRLRELAAAGEIGVLTPLHFSFMGYNPDWAGVLERLAPALVEQVALQRADAVVLVPV